MHVTIYVFVYLQCIVIVIYDSRLSPSVYLCGGCARVKLALYVSSFYVYSSRNCNNNCN